MGFQALTQLSIPEDDSQKIHLMYYILLLEHLKILIELLNGLIKLVFHKMI